MFYEANPTARVLHACCLPCPPFSLGPPASAPQPAPISLPFCLGPPPRLSTPFRLSPPPSAPQPGPVSPSFCLDLPRQPPAWPRLEQLSPRSKRGPRCPALPSALQALCHLLAFSSKGAPFLGLWPLPAWPPAPVASAGAPPLPRFQRPQGSLLTGTRHFPRRPQPVPRAHPPHSFSQPVGSRSTSTGAVYSVKSMPDLTLKIEEIKSKHSGQTDLKRGKTSERAGSHTGVLENSSVRNFLPAFPGATLTPTIPTSPPVVHSVFGHCPRSPCSMKRGSQRRGRRAGGASQQAFLCT